ncbi:hypothetical protein V8F20_001367 [Naviculisporaceae sp. PSN 640]
MITNRQSQILTPTGTFNPTANRSSTLSPFPPIPSSPLSVRSPSPLHPSPLDNSSYSSPPPYQASAPEPTPSALERSLTSLTTASQKDGKQLPFPRWVTLSTRGFLTLLELGSLGYGAYFLAKYMSDATFDKNRHELAVATVGIAAGLDLSAVILAAMKRYGMYGYWMFAMLVDLCIGIMGCVAAIKIYMVHLEHGEKGVEEHGMVWEDEAKILGLCGLVVG